MASGYAPSPSTIAQAQTINAGSPPPPPAASKFAAVGIEKLHELKGKSPNAEGMTDAQFALALHEHYYKDVPLQDFLKGVGLERGDVLYDTRKPGDKFGDYARKALATPGAGETADDAAKRQGGSLPDRRPGKIEGMARAAFQGATFGAGDEIVAAGSAVLDPLVHGNSGKSLGQRFDAYRGREAGLVDNFREDDPVAAYGAEIAGAIPTSLALGAPAAAVRGPVALRVLAGTADAAAQGAVYGFAGTEGDASARGQGAALGAGLGVIGAGAGAALGKAVQGIGGALSSRAAGRAAVAAAPEAGAIKATAKAGFKAAESTGAIVQQSALPALKRSLDDIATYEGLRMPSGKLIADDFPKVRGLIQTVDEYARGPLSIKQAQVIWRRAQKAAGSSDPGEQAIGLKMKEAMESYFDGLTPADFLTGPANSPGATRSGTQGVEAMDMWRQARADWARFKRTDRIETALYNAKLGNGNLADNLRSEFRKILTNPKKRNGLAPEDISAMETLVQRGTADDLVDFANSGGVLSATLIGHLAGGPVAGAVLGGAKALGGAAARGALDNRALGRAEGIRAGVALGGTGFVRAPARQAAHMSLRDWLRSGGAAAAQTQRRPLEITVYGGGQRQQPGEN